MKANKRDYPQREELSDEGKKLWDRMMNEFDSEVETEAIIKEKKVVRQVVKVDTAETIRLRLELRKLHQNSRIVIADCEQKQKVYIKRNEYFKANECRVAAICHRNLISRIDRILDGLTAFENDFNLTED